MEGTLVDLGNVAHDYYGNSVHDIIVQYGHDNRMTECWSHSTAIPLANGRKRSPTFDLV